MRAVTAFVATALLSVGAHAQEDLAAKLAALPDENTARIALPPDSLAQWYPPQSPKPEFRMLMFGLGRAMQASADYHALEQRELLAKWSTKLAQGYRRVGEMVPEWKGELELEWADTLERAATAGDYATVGRALHRIGTSCGSCHNEFRPGVKALYHIPDYAAATVESSETLEEVPYPKAMGRLGTAMQRIGIALEDGRMDYARSNAAKFGSGLDDLAASCGACHEDQGAHERIFGAAATQARQGLSGALEAGDAQAAGQALGRLGGAVCGSCHDIHRPAATLRHAIVPHEH